MLKEEINTSKISRYWLKWQKKQNGQLRKTYMGIFSIRSQTLEKIQLKLNNFYPVPWASLVVEMVKNLPAIRETWVQSRGWEDPLGEKMTTHSSILAWRIPGTEEPGKLQSMGLQTVGHDWATKHSTHLVPTMCKRIK